MEDGGTKCGILWDSLCLTTRVKVDSPVPNIPEALLEDLSGFGVDSRLEPVLPKGEECALPSKKGALHLPLPKEEDLPLGVGSPLKEVTLPLQLGVD